MHATLSLHWVSRFFTVARSSQYIFALGFPVIAGMALNIQLNDNSVIYTALENYGIGSSYAGNQVCVTYKQLTLVGWALQSLRDHPHSLT